MFRVVTFVLLILTFRSNWAKGENIPLMQQIEVIDSLWTVDKYDEAIQLIHKALPLVIKTYGKESKEYFQFLSMASHIYSHAGNDKQALILIEDVINGIKKNLNTNDFLYAKALAQKGRYLRDLGRDSKSIQILGEANMIFRSYEPTLEYATCQKDLAIAYFNTGQYEKAKKSILQADEILSISKSTIRDSEWVSIKITIDDIESALGNYRDAMLGRSNYCKI